MRSPQFSMEVKRKPRAVSTFLKKTYELLNVFPLQTQDDENLNCVRWAANGIGFIITNEDLFCKQVLPKYFKHSNYSSFVRQLNMYNFHKIRQNNQESYFHHEHFDRNNKNSMSEIKRKPEKKKKKNQDSEEQAQIGSDEEEIVLNSKTKKIGKDPKESKQLKDIKETKENISEKRLSTLILKQCAESARKVQSQKNTRYIFEDEAAHCNDGLIGSQSDNHELSMFVEEDDKFDYQTVRIPRLATRDLICPSRNNLFPISIENVQTSTLSIFY